jgi:hypothetical protein
MERMELKLDGLYTRLDERFDDLRKELQASFVLQAVFDVWAKRVEILDSNRRNLPRDIIAYFGGVLGIVSILNAWFHFIHP